MGLSLLWLPACAVAQNAEGTASALPASTLPASNQPAPAAPAVEPVAQTQPAAPAADLHAIEQHLKDLQKTGQTLLDFSAKIKLTEVDNATGLETQRIGKIVFQRRGPGDDRIRVTFESEKIADGDRILRKLEYLLQDGKMWDRDYSKKTETIRQITRPGEKIDLLKLGEGPFPLPIGQDPAEVHKQFEVSQSPSADDPADSFHLVLTPRVDSSLARKLKQLDVIVGNKSLFPERIITLDPQQTKVQTIELNDLKLNAKLEDKAFELPSIDGQEWSRHEEAYQE